MYYIVLTPGGKRGEGASLEDALFSVESDFCIQIRNLMNQGRALLTNYASRTVRIVRNVAKPLEKPLSSHFQRKESIYEIARIADNSGTKSQGETICDVYRAEHPRTLFVLPVFAPSAKPALPVPEPAQPKTKTTRKPTKQQAGKLHAPTHSRSNKVSNKTANRKKVRSLRKKGSRR